MAGVFPRDAHRPFVVAVITDEPAEQLTALRSLSSPALHKYAMLAAAATAQTMGEEATYSVPIWQGKSVCQELYCLEVNGWYHLFDHLHFWPVYLNGQGSRLRKLEGRYQRTTECGAS